MKKAGISRFTLAVGAILLAAGELAAEPAGQEKEKCPPLPPGKDAGKMFPGRDGRKMPLPGRGFGGPGRGAAMWRVFSRLDEPTRKKMLELQRNDPEKFFVEMRRLTEEYMKKDQLRRQQMQALIDKYRASTDKAEREKLKAELTRMEKAQFARHIAGLSSTIESTKRRLAFMEKELNKRKEKADAIVEARVEALLSGELPVSPPDHRRGPRPGGPPHKTPPRP